MQDGKPKVLICRAMFANGPAIKGVFVAEGTEAVGRIYRIDFQVL